MSKAITSATAITIFSIGTGVAAGLASIYLSAKHGENKVESSSVVTSVLVGVIATLVAAVIIKKKEQA